MGSSVFVFLLLAFNFIVIAGMFTKLKNVRWWKRVLMFIVSFVLSLVVFFITVDRCSKPLDSQVKELVISYAGQEAKNIKTESISEDKTKGNSYVVLASYSKEGSEYEMTINVTRLDGFNQGWHADGASSHSK